MSPVALHVSALAIAAQLRLRPAGVRRAGERRCEGRGEPPLEVDGRGGQERPNPGVRATGLAGALVILIFRDGDAVGALGVADRGERTLSEAETRDPVEAGWMLAKPVPAPMAP